LPTENALYIALVVGVVALVMALILARSVLAAPRGDGRMIELSDAIRAGSRAFLTRQHLWMTVLVIAAAAVIAVVFDWGRPWGAVAYLFGAVLTGLGAVVGVRVATAANTRTTNAARLSGVRRAFRIASSGGAVVGLTVAGLGLLAVGVGYLVFGHIHEDADWVQIVVAIALGGSSIALFARISGGIYTKAADLGADLRVEVDIPEDDPRQPAVIADKVGDNVGNVGGMAADLSASYLCGLVAPLAYAALVFSNAEFLSSAVVFPLSVAALGSVGSMIGAFMRGGDPEGPSDPLTRGALIANALTILGVGGLAFLLFDDTVEHWQGLWVAVSAGLVVAWLVGKIAEWFTSDRHKTVKEVARQSQTGPGTVIISGIAMGMRSSVYSMLVVAAGIAVCYYAGEWAMGTGGGIYGVTVAAIGAVATVGTTVSVAAFGPIADNAVGIASMARLPDGARQATDTLNAIGDGAAAAARGLGLASALVPALALFVVFTQVMPMEGLAPQLLLGLFVGAMVPFLVASLTISAVGRAATRLTDEVRRQFREMSGIRDGTVSPDYGSCVEITTSGALRETILPVTVAIALPIGVGSLDVQALSGLMVGALTTGFLLAAFMTNSGGAWDNAKRLVETGAFGGKDSDAHRAAVVGDNVGDPFKDTAGPALNVLMKAMAILSLVIASVFAG
jgi:K(+)-stimulated pyrophosphate-energized sodium pump